MTHFSPTRRPSDLAARNPPACPWRQSTPPPDRGLPRCATKAIAIGSDVAARFDPNARRRWPGVARRGYTPAHGDAPQTGRRAEEGLRSEEHTSELQSLMRTSYAVFCLKTKN